MKIVVDTNVMISGIFFGGFPQKVLRAIVANEITACAKDAKALYVVSGDADLLVLKNYEDIDIITAKEFCQRYNL